MKLVNLAKVRKIHGISQQEIADYLHVHVTTYSNYETGNAILDADQLVKLAQLFDTSIDYLLGRNKIVRVTTYEKVDGEFKEVPTISEQIRDKLTKGSKND